MALIRLVDLAHRYSATDWALKPMTMRWEDGGAYALLGPSGCGKSTLLNLISGILRPTRGNVLFDDRDVTALPPEARSIAQVFQFPIVYDTMTVFDNLAFPLRNRGWDQAAVRRRVQQIGELLELDADLHRRAKGLSAEEQQRISLGRGLVRPDVSAVLFDEPLTVIDPHVKWLLRRKLKQIHQELRLSLIYVTHDQTEALTFADVVVVMNQGEVVQTGSPEALFETPEHRFVGEFIGSPGMNFIDCEWNGSEVLVAGLPLSTSSREPPARRDALAVGIRPEYVGVGDAPGPNRLPATLVAIRDHGLTTLVELQVGGRPLRAKLSAPPAISASRPVFAHLPPQRCALYAEGRRRP
jgi:glycerol transport system ATP-binding protein